MGPLMRLDISWLCGSMHFLSSGCGRRVRRELSGKAVVDVLLVLAVAAYLVAAIAALFHLRLRRFRRSLQAHVLWRRYWSDEPDKVKHALVKDISDTYAHNRGLLQQKAQTIVLALYATGIEVAFVGTALILSRLV